MNDQEFCIGLTHSFVLAAKRGKRKKKIVDIKIRLAIVTLLMSPYDLRCGLCSSSLLMIDKPKLSPSRIWWELT